ncbi:hypothetical protein J6590_062599 [Homalodisca vitripennis]|nr:hypothetical protein J6590_062599 [Homalodisca vitripennis]
MFSSGTKHASHYRNVLASVGQHLHPATRDTPLLKRYFTAFLVMSARGVDGIILPTSDMDDHMEGRASKREMEHNEIGEYDDRSERKSWGMKGLRTLRENMRSMVIKRTTTWPARQKRRVCRVGLEKEEIPVFTEVGSVEWIGLILEVKFEEELRRQIGKDGRALIEYLSKSVVFSGVMNGELFKDETKVRFRNTGSVEAIRSRIGSMDRIDIGSGIWES